MMSVTARNKNQLSSFSSLTDSLMEIKKTVRHFLTGLPRFLL